MGRQNSLNHHFNLAKRLQLEIFLICAILIIVKAFGEVDMKRLLAIITAMSTCAFSGLSAAYVPWQHGTYRGESPGFHARLAYLVPAPGPLLRSTPKMRGSAETGPAESAPVCYRFRVDEDLQFIRCY
jgi:hypothetical protein